MIVLGIETSCDETAVALLNDGKVKANTVYSQDVHLEFGGVVPELASRAHIQRIVPVLRTALKKAEITIEEIDGVAAVYGPGLAGALLVGLEFGKALAWSRNLPFVGVNHIEGHLYSPFLAENKPEYPFLSLIVSGGHTELIYVEKPHMYKLLGKTRDDAAGEAFDKVAKMLGIGYPGGPVIDKLARDGNPEAYDFPRAYFKAEHFDFSFSGLKTSVLYFLRELGFLAENGKPVAKGEQLNDICASFQQAVVDTLVQKMRRALNETGVRDCTVVGGVSANRRLREEFLTLAGESGVRVFFPAMEYCTDNAAMAAYTGWLRLKRGERSPLSLTAVPNLRLV